MSPINPNRFRRLRSAALYFLLSCCVVLALAPVSGTRADGPPFEIRMELDDEPDQMNGVLLVLEEDVPGVAEQSSAADAAGAVVQPAEADGRRAAGETADEDSPRTDARPPDADAPGNDPSVDNAARADRPGQSDAAGE